MATLTLHHGRGGMLTGSAFVPGTADLAYPGIDGVLGYARRMVEAGLRDNRIAALALYVVEGAGVDAHDTHRAARVLYEWLGANVQFKNDPSGSEVLQSPQFTLNMDTVAGDCEDMAILSIPFLLALPGISAARFYVVRQRGFADFNHILAQYRVGRQWYNFDVSEWHRGGYVGQPIDEPGVRKRRYLTFQKQSFSGLSGAAPENEPNLFVEGAGGVKVWVTTVAGGLLDLVLQIAYLPGDLLCPDATVVAVDEGGRVISTTFIRSGRQLFVGCFGNGRIDVGQHERVRLDIWRGKQHANDAVAAPVYNASGAIGGFWFDVRGQDTRTPGPDDTDVWLPGGGGVGDVTGGLLTLAKWLAIGAVAGAVVYVGGPLVKTFGDD